MPDSEEDLSETTSVTDDEYVANDTSKNKKNKNKTTKSKKTNLKNKKSDKKTKKDTYNKKKKKTVKKTKKADKKPKKEKAKKETKNKRTRKPKESKEESPKASLVSNFSKLGQRYMTPPPGDGTRGFYESLYEENPYSLIAIKFCVEYGIFAGQKHMDALTKYMSLQKHGHFKGATGALKPSAIMFLDNLKNKLEPKTKFEPVT